MAKILQIESATSVCSVALAMDGLTLELEELDAPNVHASMLTVFIDKIMQKAGWAYTDLDAIAVSQGPGSYTGLRIGVSTAKGLAFALDIPLIAIDTLKLMAHGFKQANKLATGLICPMIDARRMEVFTTLYDQDLSQIQEVSAMIIDETSFDVFLAIQPIYFIGTGAHKCARHILHDSAHFVSGNFNSAANMSLLAYEAFQLKEFVDVAYFEPFYLKDFVFTPSKKKLL
ncbi:MAG: tRNA (adenosine(37)-N6)-threonylcarbamoyltransferase complex dimerization subunit type 1 TsaB [Pedobacter sp.]|nr:MAG: tRNA (adenosine(37)-N6)-threonylcarbamoyltransferase complex dimerization subunit type 1 TsaB [Pedobacter sp.]